MNGDIECFTGWHIPLAVLAIAVLAFCTVIIPVVFIYAQGYVKVWYLVRKGGCPTPGTKAT